MLLFQWSIRHKHVGRKLVVMWSFDALNNDCVYFKPLSTIKTSNKHTVVGRKLVVMWSFDALNKEHVTFKPFLSSDEETDR